MFKAGIIKLEAMKIKTRKAREIPISTKSAKLLKKYMAETEDFNVRTSIFLTYTDVKYCPTLRERDFMRLLNKQGKGKRSDRTFSDILELCFIS
jgi:integrase